MSRDPQSLQGLKKYFNVLFQAFKNFLSDGCIDLSASIAYYITFSLPPLLIFIVLLVGLFIDPLEVQGEIYRQIQNIFGEDAARQILVIIENARRPGTGSVFTLIIGSAALLFSATGSFLSIQKALNIAWEVMPDPEKGGAIKNFLLKRLVSLGLIMVVILLLLVSMVISGLLAAFGDILAGLLPWVVFTWLLFALNWLINIVIASLLFAAMYKILPDARITWRDVWPGALFTAILFVVGKDLFALYIGTSNPGNVFGAAGSMAIILLWIFFTALILLLGAEVTQALIRARGKGIIPLPGAVHYRKEVKRDAGE